MKIAFCDDDAGQREILRELAETYAARKGEVNILYYIFSDPEELLENSAKIGGYDIYVLDISMPVMNGIDLGVALRRAGYDGRIIYLSASEEYAVDSFRAKPFNYILKPIDAEKFSAALDEAVNDASAGREKSIIVRTKEGSVKVRFDSILWAELCRRTVVYHMLDGRVVESIQIRTTFAEAVQEFLVDDRFMQCGASMLVNLYHVTLVEKNYMMFRNTEKVYLPRRACSEAHTNWCNFWLNLAGEGKV